MYHARYHPFAGSKNTRRGTIIQIPLYICNMRFTASLLSCLLGFFHASAQNTLGTIYNTPEALDGYTLFAPSSYSKMYLVNNCGEKLMTWDAITPGSSSAQISEDGFLWRCGRTNTFITPSGGACGSIEKYDMQGNLVWQWLYSNDSALQHHDIEPMPNGHVLLISWELIPNIQLEALGGDTSGTPTQGVLLEQILEIKPFGVDSGLIVWEWDLKDHLIQSDNPSGANFGIPKDHPELYDINYQNELLDKYDLIHFNSIDYSPEYDLIVLSSRHLSEIWVLDHSVSTAEAKGHSGGTHGKGGDILYRWGNPTVYNPVSTNRILFLQHDARWINQGNAITVFNNDYQIGKSAAQTFIPPRDGNHFFYPPNSFSNVYDPSFAYMIYQANDFYSARFSGVQKLPNTNYLLTEGNSGEFTEVTDQGDTVWKYINPVSFTGPQTQGDVPNLNVNFKAWKYPITYPGFANANFQVSTTVEFSGFNPAPCTLYPEGLAAGIPENSKTALLWPNPVNEGFALHPPFDEETPYEIRDVQGSLVSSGILFPGNSYIAVPDLKNGMYFVHTHNYTLKFVRFVP